MRSVDRLRRRGAFRTEVGAMPADEAEHWFEDETPVGIDLDRPGIFEWRIEKTGTYIATSKETTIRKRLKNYKKRFRQLRNHEPYSSTNPDGFRKIHRQVVEAREKGLSVVFAAIENCSPEDVAERRRYWIGVRGTLNV
ncbi:hypothetical protein [Jiella sp. M17.18]|uniref:hypothetical protein n=1 Tax=Jiella sp. M17.18 TaxID=3234247 RepID=UPI0034DF403B